MTTPNPFKQFIPYLVGGVTYDTINPEVHGTRDPTGGTWRTIGLTEPYPGEGLVLDLNIGRMLAVQFNERILPGKVRDEKLALRLAEIEKAEGRKLNKKEYAQLREEVEFDLLPKAFIRRSVVPVILCKGYMLVFTASQSKADSAVYLLTECLGSDLRPWKLTMAKPVEGNLTFLAKHREFETGGQVLEPTDSATLKGEGKKTIRIKDKSIDDHDIHTLLRQDYEVHELGLQLREDDEDDPLITFTVNGNLTFKRVLLPDVAVTPYKEDFFGLAVLYVRTIYDLLQAIEEAFGPLAPRPEPEQKKAPESMRKPAVAFDDDDEL